MTSFRIVIFIIIIYIVLSYLRYIGWINIIYLNRVLDYTNKNAALGYNKGRKLVGLRDNMLQFSGNGVYDTKPGGVSLILNGKSSDTTTGVSSSFGPIKLSVSNNQASGTTLINSKTKEGFHPQNAIQSQSSHPLNERLTGFSGTYGQDLGSTDNISEKDYSEQVSDSYLPSDVKDSHRTYTTEMDDLVTSSGPGMNSVASHINQVNPYLGPPSYRQYAVVPRENYLYQPSDTPDELVALQKEFQNKSQCF